MIFRDKKKNPAIYFSEITQYVEDLQRITLLRDKCTEQAEQSEYDNILHCMREVMLFMNTIAKKDRARLPALEQ